MSEINPDTPPKPIEVTTSLAAPQLATGLRDVAIMVGFATALLGFVGKRDLAGAINYLQSEQALPALALILATATLVYRQWKARREKAVKITLAAAAPDAVAKVVSSRGAQA